MDPRIADLLRYIVLAIVFLAVAGFGWRHYQRFESKRALVAEMQTATSEASFYRQFEQAAAEEVLLQCIARMKEAETLGLPPAAFFDKTFKRKKAPDTYEGFPPHEKLVRDTLTRGYEAARQLDLLEDYRRIQELKAGRMPNLTSGTPVILPLIDPVLSPGIEKIIPNLEIHPPGTDPKTRQLSAIEISAARELARDLQSANLIEKSVSTKLLEHYQAIPEKDTK